MFSVHIHIEMYIITFTNNHCTTYIFTNHIVYTENIFLFINYTSAMLQGKGDLFANLFTPEEKLHRNALQMKEEPVHVNDWNV